MRSDPNTAPDPEADVAVDAGQLVRVLLRNDFRRLVRDPFMWMLMLLTPVFALVLRVAETVLAPEADSLLVELYPLFVGQFLVLTPPLLAGAMVGFLRIDEREDGPAEALEVAPLPAVILSITRLLYPIIVAWLLIVICVPLSGLVTLPLPALVGVALAALPVAPLASLCLTRLASNKIQGFAVLKGLGLWLALIYLWWFVEGWARIAFSIVVPPALVVESVQLASEGDLIGQVLFIAAVGQFIFLFVIVRATRQLARKRA